MVSETERLKSLALRLKPILGPADRVGLADPLLDAYVSVTDRYDDLEKVDERIAAFELSEAEKKGEVLIPHLHAESWIANVLNLSMAHAFHTRGYEPVILTCYRSLPMCMEKQYKSDDASTCAMCHHESVAWLDAFGLEPTYVEDVLPDSYGAPVVDDPFVDEYTHEGVDVLKLAKSTTRKFLRKHRLDKEDDHEREILRRFIQAGVQLVEATDGVLARRDIDAVVGHHSGYLYGGTVLATGVAREVPTSVVTTFLAHRPGVILVSNMRNRHTLPPYAPREAIEYRLSTPLTSEEERAVDEYMAGRRDGSTIPDNKHFTKGSHRAIDVPEDTTHLGLFSNLMWDASLINSHDVFNSPFSWVMATIDHVADREDVVLTIKPHPAEAVRHSNDKMATWIRHNVDPIPENVTVLNPDTEVNPYEMIETLDVGLVYNSTLGIEMVYDDIPVVVTGDAHYRGFGFTYDPETPAAYVDLMQRPADLTVSDEMRDRVRRYAHYFFLERPIEYPQFGESPEMDTVDHDELGPGNERIDHIVERILADDRNICYPPRDWGGLGA